MKLPLVRRWRLLPKTSLPRGSAPLGVPLTAPVGDEMLEGDALWFSPASGIDAEVPSALASTLPEPGAVSGLIVIGPLASQSGFLARVLGREARVARAVRGSALLLRGYSAIGGGLDPASGLDLCWATTPPR